jgi:hypothetical protein
MADVENIYKIVNFLIFYRLWIIYYIELDLFLYLLRHLTANVNWGYHSNFYLKFLLT